MRLLVSFCNCSANICKNLSIRPKFPTNCGFFGMNGALGRMKSEGNFMGLAKISPRGGGSIFFSFFVDFQVYFPNLAEYFHPIPEERMEGI